ncbi:MAG: flagellar biosynthetic protein FliO [Firmicutes bacterium]|jgi:flagellar biosynthetic protein FliO|nr:flagellar biosynthetic protein FliO [Bacillota bacterium]MCL5992686.1 flagellar biosynthetic protein FliO [Bacillota bacterium]
MDSFLEFMRVLFSLLFVLALAWWSTRYGLPLLQGTQARRKANMTVVERIPLGLRGTLCLVKVGERFLLIGLTPAKIERLAEIPASELQLPEEAAHLPPDFAAILAKSKAKTGRLSQQILRRARRVKERKDQGDDHPQENDHHF